ncbi:MAG TPA: NDP-sugar synthase [Kofleriaceae bacterium]
MPRVHLGPSRLARLCDDDPVRGDRRRSRLAVVRAAVRRFLAMRAMLLCAGLSTRLGRLGSERPKPLLPVCGVPILAYGITNLVAHGITELVINTHHRAALIEHEIGNGRRFGARIHYIHEPLLLGTGGGLKHALPLLDPDGRDEPFLSINGKLIFDLDVTALVAAYRAAAQAAGDLLGMMVVRRVPDARDWGAVQVRVDDRGPYVADILGDGEHMFCGAHVTRPSVMARLPDGEADSIRQGYLPWLRAGERVAAYEHQDGYFAEHSTPERYLASNWALLGGAALRHPPSKLSGIDPTARIHPDVTIVEPVKIGAEAVVGPGPAGAPTIGPNAVIGDGAIVRASIANTVVWAGAVVDVPPGDPVVTGEAASGGPLT